MSSHNCSDNPGQKNLEGLAKRTACIQKFDVCVSPNVAGKHSELGGGFKDFLFSPLLGVDFHFD